LVQPVLTPVQHCGKIPRLLVARIDRQALLDGFVEFCSNARVVEYEESDEQIQVIDDLAVLTFRFAMVYERTNYRARSTGRDMWVFRSIGGKWLALWRTMMELEETRETPP